MEAYLTISTHFSAAHRLALPTLSFDENVEIYGKCAPAPTVTVTTTIWK
jgi:6-pyruvoyltetrahydropterin/6-carboxytetrahydropterin synthase